MLRTIERRSYENSVGYSMTLRLIEVKAKTMHTYRVQCIKTDPDGKETMRGWLGISESEDTASECFDLYVSRAKEKGWQQSRSARLQMLEDIPDANEADKPRQKKARS